MKKHLSRKTIMLVAGLLALAVMTFNVAPRAQASPTYRVPEGVTDVVANEIVVAFEPGTPRGVVEDAAAGAGASVSQYDREAGLALFVLGNVDPAGDAGAAGAAASGLLSAPGVLMAEPNHVYAVSDLQPEPYAGRPTERLIQAVTAAGEPVAAMVPVPTAEMVKVGAASHNMPADPELPWAFTYLDADVVFRDPTLAFGIAFLDSGSSLLHKDLAKVKILYDYVNDDLYAYDDFGHGTHVAGIAVATTSKLGTVANGAPGLSNGYGYMYKVLDAQGTGTTFELARGLNAAALNVSVKVVSLSVACAGDNVGCATSEVLEAAIRKVIGAGKLVVVAAGNDGQPLACDGGGPGWDVYPACYRYTLAAVTACSNGSKPCTAPGVPLTYSYGDAIIVVAATGERAAQDYQAGGGLPGTYLNSGDPTGALLETNEYACKLDTSNYNGFALTPNPVDIAAPGGDIFSTWPQYPVQGELGAEGHPLGYNTLSGTSQAVPHVAAVAARVWAEHPTEKADVIKDRVVGNDSFAPNVRLIDGQADEKCWPSDDWGTTDAGDPPPALWYAGAMEMGGLWGYLYDADTGSALPKATYTYAYSGTPTLALRDTDYTCAYPTGVPSADKLACNQYDQFFLGKLPIGLTTTLKISVPLHTATVTTWDTYPTVRGWTYVGYLQVPPKYDRYQMVVSWNSFYQTDLNGYVFMPSTVNYDHDGNPGTANIYLDWMGTFPPLGIAATQENFSGDLAVQPFARYMFDSNLSSAVYFSPVAGSDSGFTADSLALDTISGRPHSIGTYVFVVANSLTKTYNPSCTNYNEANRCTPPVEDIPDACVSFWSLGLLKGRWCISDLPGSHFNAGLDEDYWIVAELRFNGTTVTLVPITGVSDDSLRDLDAVDAFPSFVDYAPGGTPSNWGGPLPGFALFVGGPIP